MLVIGSVREKGGCNGGTSSDPGGGNPPPARIASLSPTSGVIGMSVTITGANFGATQGSSTVKFNGTTATPTNWSATSIVAPVPAGATTANVIVTVGGVATNGVNFTASGGTSSTGPPKQSTFNARYFWAPSW